MNSRLLASTLALLSLPAFAADAPKPKGPQLPKVPDTAIAKKKELLFSDDFSGKELAKSWLQVVPKFVQEDGAMKGIQVRDKDIPAADGKPAVTAHQAVVGNEVPTKDSIIEMRFKFGTSVGLSAEYDDRKYTGSHYGHICMVRVTPKGVSLSDQKDGSMRNDIYEMKDPAKKDERNKLLAGHSYFFPLTIDTENWHTLVLETVGDEMRASVDGKAVAYIKSPGIAHPTKSRVEFGCQGQNGFLDDIKIWNAEPVK